MKFLAPSAILLLATIAPGQTAVPSETFTNPLGFTYAVPMNWQLMDYSALAKERAGENAPTEDAKKGLACTQMGLLARHGTPSSVIAEVALPFDCFGQTMTDADLPGFAAGASEGLRGNIDLGKPALGTYKLDGHLFWIERASGTLKENPAIPFTIEIACTVGKKAAVCWMTMAANQSALDTFEHGEVSVDGDKPAALVPSFAFDKKPQ